MRDRFSLKTDKDVGRSLAITLSRNVLSEFFGFLIRRVHSAFGCGIGGFELNFNYRKIVR